jgi:hypothetical protein
MPGNRRLSTREQRRALERVSAKVARASADPIGVARDLEQAQAGLRGAHALVHVLVRRMVGLDADVVIEREQWMALPPTEHLKTEYDKDGNVTLKVAKDD